MTSLAVIAMSGEVSLSIGGLWHGSIIAAEISFRILGLATRFVWKKIIDMTKRR